jgi:4-aminobutyrate aminotransferase-like enzyme
VLKRVVRVGDDLLDAIRTVARPYPEVLDVRGVGLAIGVELADAATARAVKEGMRERGVLIGTAGRTGSVLKIRPPLAFSDPEIRVLVEALAGTLASIATL